MSEHIKITPEKQEKLAAPEQPELLAAQASPEKLAAAEKAHVEAAHEARAVIAETTAADTGLNPLERLEAAEKTPQTAGPAHVNQELKTLTLRRELQQIRRRLPAPQRALSHVIHQPVVRVISETTSKTVSRPSGLLGGGLVAFLGTSGYLYLAKQNGFRYNYVIFIVLFGGGFILGLILELLVHLATASRRKAHD